MGRKLLGKKLKQPRRVVILDCDLWMDGFGILDCDLWM